MQKPVLMFKSIYTLSLDASMCDLYRTWMQPSTEKSSARDCTVSFGFISKCLISFSLNALPFQLRIDTCGDILVSLVAGISGKSTVDEWAIPNSEWSSRELNTITCWLPCAHNRNVRHFKLKHRSGSAECGRQEWRLPIPSVSIGLWLFC